MTPEHFEGVFLLAERIVDATEIGIGMIATLMIEGVPLATANKLPLSMAHGSVGIRKGKGCGEHGLFTPSTGSTVQTVVGIPVINHFTKLTREDTFVGKWFCLRFKGNRRLLRTRSHGSRHIVRPSVKHVVVVLYASGIHIGSGYRTSGVGELFAGNLQGF